MNNEIAEPQEGILLVDKMPGWTSFNVVSKVRGALQVKKVGHCGTLDPFATGLLVILIGKKYTRMCDEFTGQDKLYDATITLGKSTDSDDIDGNVIAEAPYDHLSEGQIKSALSSFVGKQFQTPPQFSAISVNGVRAYKQARKGRAVALAPREVEIYSIELLEMKLPHVHVRVRASKGTYIRAVARDLGKILSVPAHLSALRRLKSGTFDVKNAVPIKTDTVKSDLLNHIEKLSVNLR